MIDFLIALLLTISTGGDPCDLGTSTDWYSWIDAHVDAAKVFTYEAAEPNLWLYEGKDGEVVLFVFKEPIEDTIARGEYAAHGRCSRLVTIDG